MEKKEDCFERLARALELFADDIEVVSKNLRAMLPESPKPTEEVAAK